MNFMKVAVVMAVMLCAPGMPALGQSTPAPEALQEFNQIMEALRPELLLEYAVETDLSFTYDGEAVASQQVHICKVIHDKGTLTARRDQIIGVPGRADSHHAVLADGRALVFFDINPCTWITTAPEPGRDYALTAMPDDPRLSVSSPEEVGTIKGSVLLLDDAANPREVRSLDMAEFLSSSGVAGVKLVARATQGQPSNTLAADIPALSGAIELVAMYEQYNGAIPPELLVIYMGLQQQATHASAVFFRIRAVVPRAVAPGATAAPEPGSGWAISSGSRRGETLETYRASFALETGRLDIDLTSGEAERIGTVLNFGRPRPAAEPLRYQPPERRDISVCLEGECLPVSLTLLGGQGTGYYTLTHGHSGRTLELTILTDDLTEKVR